MAPKPTTIRHSTPPIDQNVLERNLIHYVSKVGTARAFDLGVYTGIPMGHAVRAKGLLALYLLVETLIDSAHHMLFTHLMLKNALLAAAFSITELHDKKKKIDR